VPDTPLSRLGLPESRLGPPGSAWVQTGSLWVLPAGTTHDDDNPETSRVNYNSPYYYRIQKYLQKHAELDNVDEKFKDECEKYELRDGILYNARTGRCVILDLEFMKETLEFAHKDIGHYGKRATSKAVAQRFEVAKDLWTEGRKVSDGCIPC